VSVKGSATVKSVAVVLIPVSDQERAKAFHTDVLGMELIRDDRRQRGAGPDERGFLGLFFLGSLDFERVLGYGPMAIGLAFLPVAVVMALCSVRFSAQLIGRFGPYAMLVSGLSVAGAALAMVGFGPNNPNYAIHLLLPMAMLGLGGGLAFPSLTMIAMADIAPSDAGLASGLLNTTGQVGGAFGLAVLATVAGGRTLSLAGQGVDRVAALAGGYHFAWLVCAAVVANSLAGTVWLLRPKQIAVAAATSPDAACCEAAA
jgi:MFS family permease